MVACEGKLGGTMCSRQLLEPVVRRGVDVVGAGQLIKASLSKELLGV